MLRRGAIQSLRALLVLADEPGRWCSVAELARRQDLPGARLEQLLLRLRRAGVLEARRGRRGGYRLARPAAELSLAAIFTALEAGLPGAALPWSTGAPPAPGWLGRPAAAAQPDGSPGASPAADPDDEPDGLGPDGSLALKREGPAAADAGSQVTTALNRRLQRALERELARTSLEDLHHDLRSARALLSDDGGLLLG